MSLAWDKEPALAWMTNWGHPPAYRGLKRDAHKTQKGIRLSSEGLGLQLN